MIQRIGRFAHVSQNRFEADWQASFAPNAGSAPPVGSIPLPRRATRGSAGYDFYLPADIRLEDGKSILIPTGVRVFMEEGWVLAVFPRSGLGVRFRFRLNNSTGIIDSDYAYTPNEGHILLAMSNENGEGKTLTLPAGKAFAQGVFLPFGITEDDETQSVRSGGFGSTGETGGSANE